MIWDDFKPSFLNAAQQTKAQEFAAIGVAVVLFRQGKGPKPNISGVTYGQMKATDAKIRELNTLVGPAIMGFQYVKEELEAAALKAFKDANP